MFSNLLSDASFSGDDKEPQAEALGPTATGPNLMVLKALLMFARGLPLPTTHTELALSHQLFETHDCLTSSRQAQALRVTALAR